MSQRPTNPGHRFDAPLPGPSISQSEKPKKMKNAGLGSFFLIKKSPGHRERSGQVRASGQVRGKAAQANEHAPAIRRVAAEGDSSGWRGQQENHSVLGDAFLAHVKEADDDLSAKWGTVWDDRPL